MKYPGQDQQYLKNAWRGDGVAPELTRQMERRRLMDEGLYIADKRRRRLERLTGIERVWKEIHREYQEHLRGAVPEEH